MCVGIVAFDPFAFTPVAGVQSCAVADVTNLLFALSF
jgi:hypothetical protein